MVYRVYVEKKKSFANEAASVLADIRSVLGVSSLTSLRLLNRYDIEGIDKTLFDSCVGTVFSEPQTDTVRCELDADGAHAFAVEYLPGQFDQRADSAAQCVQIISQGERPVVRTAKVYLLYGNLTDDEFARVKRHLINPIEAREASLAKPPALQIGCSAPGDVETLRGFTSLDRSGIENFIRTHGLAMDADDLEFCRRYFAEDEGRDPTITEIRVIDTYWSDHCRHTTFLTALDSVTIEDPVIQAAYEDYLAARTRLGRKAPVSLMDMGTIAAKLMRAEGRLDALDESEEINACTVKIDVDVDGEPQKWLLLFKNETHNHPTEIEPFGGAATCLGGAIRDPLSGRAYVYAAMRLTGAADPLTPVSETLRGKLPQRKIVTAAAAGYSSYGNQIGLATGQVDELYHPGYAAKRMEIGAVIAAVPAANVQRKVPEPGDLVVLLGGRTGRDGCGGATGSSKSHDLASLETCGTEVQKGNPPEERKLQRLFRNPEASRLIKRCNDFGAGGVSVAIGELADGLDIDLGAVPKKYEGLDSTELAISESQERMAAVVAPSDAEKFLSLAAVENLEATIVAKVKAEPRLTMRLNGRLAADLSRVFLDTRGAQKHASAAVAAPMDWKRPLPADFAVGYAALAGSLGVCSKRGLAERFDSTIGAGTVLMPFGGTCQLTPPQAMVHRIPLVHGHTDDCSFMAWGFDPYLSEKSPYHGAYLAVVESVCRLVATGAAFSGVYLSFQEYFEKLGLDPRRWGKPVASLLGAFEAQRALGVAAIGGKDSMSGSFLDLDVPPTLVSFAVTTGMAGHAVSPEFKAAGHRVALLSPECNESGLPDGASLRAVFETVTGLMRAGRVCAAWTPGAGGVAEGVLKMCFGNNLGFAFDAGVSLSDIFGNRCGSFLVETTDGSPVGTTLGYTTEAPEITWRGETLVLSVLERLYEEKLEPVYPCSLRMPDEKIPLFRYEKHSAAAPAVRSVRPSVLIPVFPGTNCEYDTARAFEDAGARADVFVVRNLSASDAARSVEEFADRTHKSEMLFIPGGFSAGDEPDGSGKFIAAFFRSGAVKDAVTELLDVRGGLVGGICNGFQALLKLGLLPYGRILDADASFPTLTYNRIGRHQSRLVRTRVCSALSPWLAETQVGEIYTVPISHGEGRFYAADALIRELSENGQIATQYVGPDGAPASDIRFNPNGSAAAVEGITSPDGRVFGRMGHSERTGAGLYRNVPGNYDIGLFRAAVKYFQ